jgi:hypothetical protein
VANPARRLWPAYFPGPSALVRQNTEITAAEISPFARLRPNRPSQPPRHSEDASRESARSGSNL